MTDFGGVETFRFVSRGVEVNGKEFVPYRELENCQVARERAVRAHTEAWEEIERMKEALRTYAAVQPLHSKPPGQLQDDLRAIAGQEHIHVASIGSDSCLVCCCDRRAPVHKRMPRPFVAHPAMIEKMSFVHIKPDVLRP